MTSEVRRDPWSGAEVVLAPGRLSIGATRPSGLPTPSGRCPFCPGHEADAEATILAIGEPWETRVVGNRFPLVGPTMPHARGAHEVIIETRAHDVDLPDLDTHTLTRILSAYRDRSAALARLDGARAIVLFRNRGRRAGSSQPHPHAQIVALDYVPPEMRRRDAIALADPELRERVIDSERRGARVVCQGSRFVAFAPFASGRAYEVRLAPLEPIARLAETSDEALADLATQLGRVLRALREHMGLTDYNVLVRDPALGTRGTFFSIDVLPRTGGDAGFELHTGSSICLVAPEITAAALRALAGPDTSA